MFNPKHKFSQTTTKRFLFFFMRSYAVHCSDITSKKCLRSPQFGLICKADLFTLCLERAQRFWNLFAWGMCNYLNINQMSWNFKHCHLETNRSRASSSCAGSWWSASWWRLCPGGRWHCVAEGARLLARRTPRTPFPCDIEPHPWTSPSCAPSSP